jgi:hypothetical protein
VAVSGLATQPPGGGFGEFFRYHGVWAPGVRLFRAIGFRSKATIIALAFALPLALLGWNYFHAQAVSIEFSARASGSAYAKQAYRCCSGSSDNGWPSTRWRCQPCASRSTASACSADVQAPWRAWARQVNLRAGQRAADTLEGARAVRLAPTKVQALLDLLGVSTDGQPDAGPRHRHLLSWTPRFRLPVMLETAAQLRDLGAALLADGATTPAQTCLVEQITCSTAARGHGGRDREGSGL